jgi:hypothetical protein
MREVEEETGVNQSLVQNYKLKITHWFEMESSFEGVPQLERALKSSLVET